MNDYKKNEWAQQVMDLTFKLQQMEIMVGELKKELIDERKMLKMTRQDLRGLNLLIDKLNVLWKKIIFNLTFTYFFQFLFFSPFSA